MTSGRPIEPNCLVITVDATFPENKGRIGRVVELTRPATPFNQSIWLVEFQRPGRVKQNGCIFLSIDAHVPDAWLRRIDADPLDEQVDTVITRGIEEHA